MNKKYPVRFESWNSENDLLCKMGRRYGSFYKIYETPEYKVFEQSASTYRKWYVGQTYYIIVLSKGNNIPNTRFKAVSFDKFISTKVTDSFREVLIKEVKQEAWNYIKEHFEKEDWK